MPEATTGTFTQAPAAIAFSTLYARVQNYVLAPSDTDVATIAKEGINEAISRLNTRRWNWARHHADITLVAGTQEYALSATFKGPRAAELLDSTGEVVSRLEFLDPKELDYLYPDRHSQGYPSHYTIFNEFANGMLTLSATPSSGFVTQYPKVRVRFFRRIPYLSADADLFYGPTEAETYLVWYARANVAAHWALDKIGFAEKRAEELWTLLVRDDEI